MNSGISRTFELFSQGLERLHEETEVLDEVDKSIVVGQCWFFNNHVLFLLRQGFQMRMLCYMKIRLDSV